MFVLSLSQVAFARVLKYSALVVPFALVAVTVLFVTPGEPWLSLPVGNRTVVASVPGLVRFASILLRSWFSVQMAILLAMTTSLPDVLHALRHLGLPDVLAAITSFMVRYLSVLVEEAGRLLRARDARRAGTRSGAAYTWWQARVTGHMAGQLFLRSVERSERVYNAMLARGFHGHFLTIHPHRMFTLDWVGAGCGVLYLALVQILVRIG